MATSTALPASVSSTDAVGEADSRRARVILILVALVIGSLISAAFGLWHPEPDGANDGFAYDTVADMRGAWWAWHIFGSIGTAVSVFAVSLAVLLLAPRRGAAWATAGAIITSLGALAFVAGASAEGVVLSYATDADALDVETGRSFVDFVNENPDQVAAIIIPGFLLMTLGAFLLAAALWRAGTVPRWLPVALGVGNVAMFVAPWGTASRIVGVVFTAIILAIGWYLWRNRHQVGVQPIAQGNLSVAPSPEFEPVARP
jgi:MFS family permease